MSVSEVLKSKIHSRLWREADETAFFILHLTNLIEFLKNRHNPTTISEIFSKGLRSLKDILYGSLLSLT